MKRSLCLLLLLLVPATDAMQKRTKADPSDPNSPEKWEYLAVAGPTTSNFEGGGDSSQHKESGQFAREAFVLEQHLDRLGSKGWELVSVAGPPTDPVYYFKRRK